MHPNQAEPAHDSAPQDDGPSQQSRHFSNHSHLKRSPAPLSVRLRPKTSKRLKVSSKTEEEELQSLATHPHAVAGRLFSRTKNLQSWNPSPSEPIRKAKAEEWFNENNKHVFRAPNAAFPDGRSCRSVTVPCGTKDIADDLPFYLPQQPSDIDSACAVQSAQSTCELAQPVPPRHAILSRMESRESNSEEFRSVIDDLTVKNKKLRQKLKQYEKFQSSLLQEDKLMEDKLFEVRIHSLPAHKKSELEQTLRSFASSVEHSPDTEPLVAAPPPTLLAPGPLPLGHQSLSPSISYSKRVDSAYASISATGQTMISQSTRNDTKCIEKQACSAELKRQNVKSYLHDVPPCVLPRKSPFISKTAKRKIVVRRLEELFTGKGAAAKGSNQSLQQQEVSQSANSEAGGRRWETKGVREARILPPGVEFLLDPSSDGQTISQSRSINDESDLKSRATEASGGETPEQRPTHPLDLDICRAQVPAENMQYIRHLGLASPMMNSDAASDRLDGWIYLNLLTSMAQLHTLNVTTEFVRKSVADLSSKFELSTDGRKIRWKGDTEGTGMSSDGDSSAVDYGHTSNRQLRHGPRTDQSDVNDVSQLSNYNSSTEFGAAETRRPTFPGQFDPATNFHYRPLFFRGARSEDDEDSYVHDDDSLTSYDDTDDVTGADSHSRDPGDSKAHSTLFRRRRENGPIIFYNKAKFCTDLSGDFGGACAGDISFTRFTDEPIGREMLNSLGRTGLEGPESLSINGRNRTDSVKAGSNASGITDSHLTIEQPEPFDSDEICEVIKPIYLEASGLGGVQPQDNLLIDVQVQHGKQKRSHDHSHLPSAHAHVRRIPHNSRLKIAPFHDSGLPKSVGSTESLVEAKIISSRVTVLPPSELPDPSYLCLPFSSDNDDDDDDDDKSSNDETRPQPSPVSSLEEQPADDDAPSFLLASSDEASQESSFVTTSEGSDDSSIDLLAHARVLDPDTIAAREREFDSNVGHPLPELPAGSSAATAGGGSGFSSEYSNSSLAMEESRQQVKRRRTQADRVSPNGEAFSSEDEEKM